MRRLIECWIGKRFFRDLREIIIYDPETCLIRGYIMTEKAVEEVAEKENWKVQKTVNY